MHGFLNLNKPLGITSHDAVARVRRLVGRGVKVGHAGTLDPAASGVLPLALGQATRLIEYLTDARKGYRATVRFGATTTTDDAEGEIVAELPVSSVDRATFERTLEAFRGTIQQIPPMYSALHHEGKRLYDLARAGEIVERPPREVTIYRLEIGDWASGIGDQELGGIGELLISNSQPLIILDVECSKGTYIRSLARDLGEALGCGAHLAALQRTAVGSLTLDNAINLATLEADRSLVATHLLPLEFAVADWPAADLNEQQATFVRNGRPINLPDQPGEHLRAHAPDGTLLAVLRRAENQWKTEKVFHLDER